ncbi:TPA: hypothetical protein N0F65_003501 [Lagenidium giganteum]|uniref:Ribulose-1,5-bisphosphate carboxylase/oxygenase large subunit n=1 Tax=Lagenidium giganteum TaxID=4803 RepID=A0AAV2YKL1_9STRA|nr:TPA: hypothetical protein N0F65_003501 [Lagenidium giganteum]
MQHASTSTKPFYVKTVGPPTMATMSGKSEQSSTTESSGWHESI